MNMIPPPIALDYLNLGPGVEWVNGRPVEKTMGTESGGVSMALAIELGQYVRANRLGFVVGGSEVGFQLPQLSKKQVRKPDVAFVARGRFPDDRLPRGDAQLAPDLAAETISPNDGCEDMEERITDLLLAGVRLVWVLYPSTKTAYVLRADKSAARLTESDSLSGEDIVPGFSLPLASLFASTTLPPP